MIMGKALIIYATIIQGEPTLIFDQIEAQIGIGIDDIQTTCAKVGEAWMKKDELNNVGFRCYEIQRELQL